MNNSYHYIWGSLIYMTVSIILCLVVLSLAGFYIAIRPFRLISHVSPQSFHITCENVEFTTIDHVTLRGWFIPAQAPHASTVILLHGYPADKGNILPAMLFLHKKFNLLLFDFRYFGESGGHYSTVGKNEILDLKAAIQFLGKRGVHKVGVWGFSMGAAVAIMTAPTTPEIKAIVSESSYADLSLMLDEYYRIPLIRYPLAALTRLWARLFPGYDINDVSPMRSAAGLKIPVLLIHSEQDDVIPFSHALLLKKALSNNPKAEFLFSGNLSHGEIAPDHDKAIQGFFEKNLDN